MRLKAVLLALFALTMTASAASDRPPVAGRNAGISAGHPLTTAAAFEVLTKGGNAFDAGAAAMLVGGVVEQDLYSLGGEGLVLVYPQSTKKVVAVVGQGWAPKAATIDYFTSRHKTLNGAGLDPAVVPGAAALRLKRPPAGNTGPRGRRRTRRHARDPWKLPRAPSR